MPDFKKLLSKNTDEIKRPPTMPPGTYYGNIVGHKFGESRFVNEKTNEKDGVVNFAIKISHWDADADTQEAEVAHAKGKLVYAEFNLEDGQEWPLKAFLEALGLHGVFDSTIPQTTNASVMFTLTRRFDQRPDKAGMAYNDVRNVRAAA